MRQSEPDVPGAPKPEDLAAYVDGQLEPARRQEVESWLEDHPEAAEEIEGQRQLAALWQATTPVEPENPSWPSMLARIDAAFGRFRLLRGRNRRLIQIGAAGLAAGLLLLLWIPRGEPLAVVSPDEVEIVSLRAADRVTLVVGIPPVTEPLVLASTDDIEFEGVAPAPDGMFPSMDDQFGTPMIVPAATPD
jgi:anti-sigma factor RsiW